MKVIKLISFVIVILAGLSVSAQAWQQAKSTKPIAARAVVVSLYNQHKRRSPFFQTRSRALLDKYFTRELSQLLWGDAHSSGDEVGALDGDPLFNAQDMEIKNFSIHEGTGGTTAAEVPVSFENFGKKHQIIFRLVPSRPGWRIADLVYDDGATLAGVLKRDRGSAANNQDLKVYLIAVGDDGKAGRKVGCGDSLVAVTHTVQKTKTPLTAALRELLLTPPHPEGSPNLENFWKGRNLRLRSVSIRNQTATIRISGEVFVAGICDIPRIEGQINATAQQFPTVKKVRVFIGNQTLAQALR